MSINWDLTNNIHASLSTGTNAEVEQPYSPVNKSLYPDEYSVWKDSVWRSISHFGRPLAYSQSFNLSWKVPIDLIPAFQWASADFAYDATYGWERGAVLEDNSTLGNTINNNRNIRINSRFNLEELYNMVPYLQKVNKYFASKGSGRSVSAQRNKKPAPVKPQSIEKEIQLMKHYLVIQRLL